MGKNIYALKISDNPGSDENEPEILLTGCLHGDEDYPQAVLLCFAERLCAGYANNAQIKELLDNREVWILPILNPDGLEGHNLGHRPNANGVDLNRNFGFMWNPEFPNSINPDAFSEPESRLLRDFILSHNFTIAVDYHSGLQGIIYPWYYRSEDCPDFAETSHLANEYDAQSGYDPGTFAVTTGYDLYPTNGSMVEFCYGSLGVSAFAVELRSTFNFITFNQAVDINQPSILRFFEKAGAGIRGVVRDADTQSPVEARISVNDKLPSYTSAAGDFHKFLLPGTYTVTVSANGYEPKTLQNVVVNASGDATPLDIQLTPGEQFSAFKMLACRNFNNTADPGLSWNALGSNDGAFYALGDTGYVVLDMGGAILDQMGTADLTVHGSPSGTGNSYEVFASAGLDGGWVSLGTGNSTQSFSIGGVVGARYIRITDNGTGQGGVAGAGFHLDAITVGGISTGTSDVAGAFTGLRVFPNPATDFITIELHNGETTGAQFFIYNQLGKLIQSGYAGQRTDVSNLSPGIYFLQIRSKTAPLATTIKFIKQ